LIGVPSEDTRSLQWSLHVGNTAEAAKKSSPVMRGFWGNGLNYTDRPRRRGHTFYLKLTGVYGFPWTIERITAKRQPAGKQRRL
jgi:hypothetical protein